MSCKTVAPIGLLLLLLLSCGAAGQWEECADVEVYLEFHQIDLEVSGELVKDTTWGSVLIRYEAADTEMYLSLLVNDFLVFQNLPLVSTEPSGEWQETYIAIDLGTLTGISSAIDVSGLGYAFTFTEDPSESIPDDTQMQRADVTDRLVRLYDGIWDGIEEEDESSWADFAPLAWHWSADATGIVRAAVNLGVPNQEAGIQECVPVAVSNSLQFLNEEHGLGLSEAELSIETMKEATQWNGNGPQATWGAPCDWWERKREYTEANGYPIETLDTQSLADAIDALENGYDVEIDSPTHSAVLVGAIELASGQYILLVKHDTLQGSAGGTVVEVLVYDASQNAFSGGAGFNGYKLDAITIEKPIQ